MLLNIAQSTSIISIISSSFLEFTLEYCYCNYCGQHWLYGFVHFNDGEGEMFVASITCIYFEDNFNLAIFESYFQGF